MTTNAERADEDSLQRQRLVDLVVFEYRSLVVRRLGVTAEWRVLEWTDEAVCHQYLAATQATRARCPVSRECLAAALASDDRAEWRGGVNRSDRERLWVGLERTYREVRDFELMRFDVSRLRPTATPSASDRDDHSGLTARPGDGDYQPAPAGSRNSHGHE